MDVMENFTIQIIYLTNMEATFCRSCPSHRMILHVKRKENSSTKPDYTNSYYQLNVGILEL